MKTKHIFSLPLLALCLTACDQVRFPGLNPTDQASSEVSDSIETTETSPDASAPTETDTENTYTFIGNPDAGEDTATRPDTQAALEVSGSRVLIDGAVYERVALSAPGEWKTVRIGQIEGNDAPSGPYYDGEVLRNGRDIAAADPRTYRDGERYIEGGDILERSLEDGVVLVKIVGAVATAPSPPQSSQTNTPTTDAGAPLRSLAELNAKACGLAPNQAPTPTVGAVAGATIVEEQRVGAAAVNALASQLVNFPGLVKMEPRNVSESGSVSSGHCSATRIAENWFITAAHCVDESYQEIQLISGSENIRSPMAHIFLASQSICHGGYNGSANGYANDIALIRVASEQLEALGDLPIANYGVSSKALVPVNYETLDMAGWGLTSFGGQLSNQLLGATLTLESAGPAVINVTSRAGAGPCIGDSGGPLFVTEEDGTRTVVGVLSVVEQNRTTGQFCSGDYKGRYTNLEGYRDWIGSVIERCESDEEICQ